jgi:hypothetical protein
MISAATDTTSSALDRIFHILASNQDIQDKLRAELLDAPENMTYEQIGPDFLPYMDSVVQEVLRLSVFRSLSLLPTYSFPTVHRYPPVAPVTFRKCVLGPFLSTSIFYEHMPEQSRTRLFPALLSQDLMEPESLPLPFPKGLPFTSQSAPPIATNMYGETMLSNSNPSAGPV